MHRSRSRYSYKDANGSDRERSNNSEYVTPTISDPEQFRDYEDDLTASGLATLVPVNFEDLLLDCVQKPDELKENLGTYDSNLDPSGINPTMCNTNTDMSNTNPDMCNTNPDMCNTKSDEYQNVDPIIEEVKESLEGSLQLNNNSSKRSSTTESFMFNLNFEDPSGEDSSNALVLLKNKLRIIETTRRESYFITIINFLNHEDTTEDLVKEGIELILQKCLRKPFWSEIFASHCLIFTKHKKFGETFKECVFRCLQKMFDAKLENQNLQMFRNYVILLGEVFFRFRLTFETKQRIKVFGAPLCELLNIMCKTGSEDNVKIIAKQLSVSGKAFNECSPELYKMLLLEVRLKLLETTDDNVRLWLLLSLDFSYYGQNLPTVLETMYANTLGSTVYNELKAPVEVFGHITKLHPFLEYFYLP